MQSKILIAAYVNSKHAKILPGTLTSFIARWKCRNPNKLIIQLFSKSSADTPYDILTSFRKNITGFEFPLKFGISEKRLFQLFHRKSIVIYCNSIIRKAWHSFMIPSYSAREILDLWPENRLAGISGNHSIFLSHSLTSAVDDSRHSYLTMKPEARL